MRKKVRFGINENINETKKKVVIGKKHYLCNTVRKKDVFRIKLVVSIS